MALPVPLDYRYCRNEIFAMAVHLHPDIQARYVLIPYLGPKHRVRWKNLHAKIQMFEINQFRVIREKKITDSVFHNVNWKQIFCMFIPPT